MRKIIFIQPALPNYRVDFFQRLYSVYGDKLSVYYAESELNDRDIGQYKWSSCTGILKKRLFGFFSQTGIDLRVRTSDILVISGNVRNLSVLKLFIKSKIRGAYIVWWGHYKSAGGGAFGLSIRKFFMLFCDAVLFYVDGEIDRFRSSFKNPIRLPIVLALNNGIDISEVALLRSEYDFFKRDIDVIFIGRLTQKAAVHILLDALSRLESRPKLHVIGEGVFKSSLIKLAEDLNIGNLVTWHGAIDDEIKISKLMNRSKIFVYPGQVGLSLIHSMAYGLPTIIHSSSENHMPEYEAFEDGVTGFSFRYNNAECLSEKMKIALSSRERLAEMSINALSKIGPDFTTAGMAQRFCMLIENLVED